MLSLVEAQSIVLQDALTDAIERYKNYLDLEKHLYMITEADSKYCIFNLLVTVFLRNHGSFLQGRSPI